MLALLMLVCESVSIAWISGIRILPAACILAALVAVFSGLRFPMKRQRIYDIMALAAVGALIKYLLTPDNPRYTGLFSSQPIALAVAEYALVMQVLQFYVKRRDDRLLFMFPGTGVIALTCAAIVDVTRSQRQVFLTGCLVFAGLAAFFCSYSRRPIRADRLRSRGRPVVLAVVLAVIAALGWTSATALFRYERSIDELVQRWLMNKVIPRRPGLSEGAPIGSVNLQKQTSAQEIMLRIRSNVRPGYFRARSYDVFDGTQWLPVTRGEAIAPRPRPGHIAAARHGGQSFRTGTGMATENSPLIRYEVWPGTSLAGSFPTPLHPVWVQTQARLMTVDSHGILRSDGAMAGLPYTVDVAGYSVTQDQWMDDGEFVSILSAVPQSMRESSQLRNLADSLFADCESTRDRIRAAVSYFRKNYSYSLRVDVPLDQEHDPVSWFLLEQPDAHCEFFASGVAVLLRLGGVPCRYVTGFVVHEENRFSREWIARNRDAHAWVEAWDRDRGWVTVEATVGDGVPQDHATAVSVQFREFLATRFQQLRIEWQRKGIRGLVTAVLRRLQSPAGAVLLMAVILAGVFVLRHRIASLAWWDAAPRDERLAAFHQVLHEVDRRIAQLGFERPASQTIDGFANVLTEHAAAAGPTAVSQDSRSAAGVVASKTSGGVESDDRPVAADQLPPEGRTTSEASGGWLQDAADWYRLYSQLRYGRGSSSDALAELNLAAETLLSQLRRP